MGHSGVVLKLVEGGLKCTELQQEIVKALLVAFHAEEDSKSCVPLFLTLTAYEAYMECKTTEECGTKVYRCTYIIIICYQSNKSNLVEPE